MHGANMMEVKDYTSREGAMGNTHYNGVPSEYGKRVAEQVRMQPKYAMPGEADGKMQGEKSNAQKGP